MSFYQEEFPNDITVRDFCERKRNCCTILSIGSCVIDNECGEYFTVLLYNGVSKVIHKENIKTRSANFCIINGVYDAVNMLKRSVDVVIITSTKIGFNSPKSPNYNHCKKILDILNEKNCPTTVCCCAGKGNELNSYIYSFNQNSVNAQKNIN